MARSLKRIALVVTMGTLLSKAGGMTRQLVIAATFGVGAAYDAYNYAYILPGFLLILLGGINGPFHTAMVSVLSRRPKEEASHVLAAVNTIVGGALLLLSTILVITADPLINLLGPGLTPEIHRIAVVQLQIMSPIALLAGLIGLGFGSLNATEEFWIPSVSPLLSSISIIASLLIFQLQISPEIGSSQFAIKGGIALAIATVFGALLQWFIQLPSLIRKKIARVKLVWDWQHPGVQEVWKVLAPATFSSGMLQINVCTDLFFASEITGAAAGLSYASLLIQAPLGLISNALLAPLLPTFSKLTDLENRAQLIKRIRQGLFISLGSMIILGALFITLGGPITTLVYERGAFNNKAVSLVEGLLIAYGIGMPTYLCRDVLIRVFYALGDGKTPFRISIAGIGLNLIFDWLFIGGPTPIGDQLPFSFGAPGLVLATALVNFFSCLALLISLDLRLKGLPLRKWSLDALQLLIAGIIAGAASWIFKNDIIWPKDSLGTATEVALSSLTSIAIFGLISSYFGIEEIKYPLISLKRKLLTFFNR